MSWAAAARGGSLLWVLGGWEGEWHLFLLTDIKKPFKHQFLAATMEMTCPPYGNKALVTTPCSAYTVDYHCCFAFPTAGARVRARAGTTVGKM